MTIHAELNIAFNLANIDCTLEMAMCQSGNSAHGAVTYKWNQMALKA
jgi:hypothetical protein